MRGLVADALRKDGHSVVEIADGAALHDAVVEPCGRRIDLVVSDICMPIVTGLAVLRSLREAGSELPVVLMTGFGDDSLRREAAMLGAVLFDKPFKLAVLRAAVLALLDGSRA